MGRAAARVKNLGHPVRTADLSVAKVPVVQHAGKGFAIRGNSSQRGYGYRWQQARERWLERNPVCVACKRQGLLTVATEVDHVIPHRGDKALFWDQANWQSLCKPCHSAKTASGH